MLNIFFNTISRITLMLILLGYIAPSFAENSEEKKPDVDDAPALFEALVYRSCQSQLKQEFVPMMKELQKDLSISDSIEDIDKAICDCATRLTFKGPRMQAFFTSPAEGLSKYSIDQETLSFLKTKLTISLLICTGGHMDNLVDPVQKK